jgi:hypothetical protein
MLTVVALAPFVGQMLATGQRGIEAADTVEIQTRGLHQLRKDLRHSIVLTGYGKIEDLASFQGDETSVVFPVVTSTNGIEYLSLTVQNTANGQGLVRRRAPVIASSYGSFTDPVVLISGPYRYVFRYYTRGGQALPAWAKDRLDSPRRVELSILNRGGDLLFRVPIVIPTFASMSAGCFGSRSLLGCPATTNDPADEEALKAYGISTSKQ